jgi:GTP-binding protein
VLLVLDAAMGLREQDKHVAQYALDEKKAMVIVVNKWDLISKTENAMSDFKKNLYLQMPFMEFAQVVFVSALKKDRIKTIFTAIDLGLKAYEDRLSTSLLNELVQDAVLRNPPSLFNGGELKIYFANQVDIKPPTFVFFCNNSNFIHFSYKRYLINCIRRVQNFDKTPLELIFRTRK